MVRLFDIQASALFTAYSPTHLFVLALFACSILCLYTFRNSLREKRAGNIVRFSLVTVLVLSELSLNVWYIWHGQYDVKDTLPLELCTISLYLSVAMLIWKSRRLFQIVYFVGIGGALQALLTPALDYDYPHFRFIEFFAAHIAIILAVLYMLWVEGYRPTLKSVFAAMGFLNLLLVAVGTVNAMTGGNYMFLARKPETASLLDVLGPYPWYLLSLEVVACLVFLLMYLPFAISARVRQVQPQETGYD
ncbi:TIGR02206 family membrane protein [Paenibacillus profundus]|uniref:TIGR02206 family membrane protein n=1 Tax=Paenibacillus profundus TaxID=1173085 RepID=A0ABS8YA88_9BACL|nr:TIGR02206 family membrane protein [Paenibacillus profundus]MCE5168828.1 TIGR02206 family membrane protein [Paenibacillus profundus]